MAKLKLEVSLPEEAMVRFVEMLAWMEWCGRNGRDTEFHVTLNASGLTKPEFKFEDERVQAIYEEGRKSMVELHSQVEPAPFISELDFRIE